MALKTGFISFFSLVLSATTLWPQVDANKGSILGTVVDPRRAAIPNVKVNAIRAETGLQRESLTNQDGQYRFGALDPGTYELKVEGGFSPQALI